MNDQNIHSNESYGVVGENSGTVNAVRENNGTIDNRLIKNFYLSGKEKKKKDKKDQANRYGLRKIIEEGAGGVLLPGAAMLNLRYSQKVKGKELHKTFINAHTMNGQYLTDHMHIPVSSLKYIKKECKDNEITGLLYVNFMGQPHNYNEERYDGLSIKVGKEDGGFVTIPPQSFAHNDEHDYYLLDLEKDIDEINGLTKVIHTLDKDEYIGYIEYFKSYINYLTKGGIVKDFIFNYILYNYFLEVSHKSLYTNEINWKEMDYNSMIDIIILLASVVYEIQKNKDIHIPSLLQKLGYKLCAIQCIYNFNDYNNNPNFKRFERNINKDNSWEIVEHRVKNLELKYTKIQMHDDVCIEGYSVIYDKLDEISFHIYKNKPA